jgi:biotin synthase
VIDIEKFEDPGIIPDKQQIIQLLSLESPDEIERLRSSAERLLLKLRGPQVYFRGLIEFSNICRCDCYYCGIRKSNAALYRYTLNKVQIVQSAIWCAQQGYGSVVLQSGERNDPEFVDFVEDVVTSIKNGSTSPQLPEGLGITLSCGEQTEESYQRWYNAGAHRYLLRIESSTPALFASLHPPYQKLQTRIAALKSLKKIGYNVGTGVMIGLPGQTLENLADDILFFKEIDADMIGMGPYIVHNATPMVHYKDEIALQYGKIFSLSQKMIAVTRLTLKNVNIAASTALQAMKEDGRETGLTFGANVIMPQVTPVEVRKNYLLYEGKPCLDENAEQCRTCLSLRVASVGRTIAYNNWGDRC